MSMEQAAPIAPKAIRWVLAFLLAAIFAGLTYYIYSGRAIYIDLDIQSLVFEARDPFITSLAKGITWMGNATTIIALCALVILLPARMSIGIPTALATGIGAALYYDLNHLIGRLRPDEMFWLADAEGYSFPSGHTTNGFIFYIVLMVLLRRYLVMNKHLAMARLASVILPLIALLLGLSRIYLGVHYPSDVLGGFIVGGFMVLVLVGVYDRFWLKKHRLTNEPKDWEERKNNKPWREPRRSAKEPELLEFPKYRSPWRKPKLHAQKEPVSSQVQEPSRWSRIAEELRDTAILDVDPESLELSEDMTTEEEE